MKDQIIVGVVTAITVSILFGIWNRVKDVPMIVSVPDNAVVAFDEYDCPKGWIEYKPAYGRFVRGIDRSNKGIDPNPNRNPGHEQDDLVGKHNHTMGVNGTDSTTMVIGGATQRLAHFRDDQYGSGNPKRTHDFGGSETRPKNVALLYCIKKS